MKLLFKPYFIVLVILYFIVRLSLAYGVELSLFFKNHFTDLLCMPIVLTICLAFVRLIKKLPTYLLTPLMIISMTVFYAVLFEYLAPLNNPNQTGDWLDVLMYGLGGIEFWLIQRLHLSNSKF
jgi:hypothetical protein